MALVFTWDTHNRIAQGDVAVPWDGGETGREPGQKSVFELRFRADPGDPWGAPTTTVIEAPNTFSYEPPGNGWVQMIAYSLRDGLTSGQSIPAVIQVVGGVPATLETFDVTDGGGEPFAVDEGDFLVVEE